MSDDNDRSPDGADEPSDDGDDRTAGDEPTVEPDPDRGAERDPERDVERDTERDIAGPAGPGAGSRLAGVLALVLGLAGSLLALVLAFLFLRALFGAGDLTDRALEPVVASFDRLEDRIDQTDDLVDRAGIDDDRIPELQARVDGLVDVSSAAHRGFEAIDDHPLYRLLPAELSDLGSAMADYRSSAELIDQALGSAPTVRPAVAASVASELDGMQAQVTDTRVLIDDAESSLRSWIRLGSFLGFIASLWGLWAQVVLARRGWRGFRGRPA